MKGRAWRFIYSRMAADIIPIMGSILVALLYFTTVMPGSRQYLVRYLVTALVLFVVSRIPNVWYDQTRLLPPIKRYKRGKREGRVFSKAELAQFYEAFAAHVVLA